MYCLLRFSFQTKIFTVVVAAVSFAEPEPQYGQDLYDLEQLTYAHHLQSRSPDRSQSLYRLSYLAHLFL
jgi:hypothetical protein